MSEGSETESTALAPAARKGDQRKAILDALRERMLRTMGQAMSTIEELAFGAENERVRLAAAQDILDRGGLSKTTTQEVVVSQAEHDMAKREADDLLTRINRNQDAQALPTPHISIDALVVHEGDDDTLPTTVSTPHDVVDTTAS